jgi:hypothetical protein
VSFDPRIFRYPAVEYIPLYILTLVLEPSGKPADSRVSLTVALTNADMQKKLRPLNIKLPSQVDFRQKMLLLALGYEIKSAYYRAHHTILQGKPLPGGYHIAVIPSGYFYKDRIHFALYDQNAEKLDWVNIKLQNY